MKKLEDLRKEIILTSLFALQFGVTSAQQVKLPITFENESDSLKIAHLTTRFLIEMNGNTTELELAEDFILSNYDPKDCMGSYTLICAADMKFEYESHCHNNHASHSSHASHYSSTFTK